MGRSTTVADFIDALKKHGLAYFGDKKIKALEEAGGYFAAFNVNQLSDEQLEESFSAVSEMLPLLKSRLDDENNPEGFVSEEEMADLAEKVLLMHPLHSQSDGTPCTWSAAALFFYDHFVNLQVDVFLPSDP